MTGEISGCPGRARNIRELVKAVKTRGKKKGAAAARNHAEAMSIEELRHLMVWSASMSSQNHIRVAMQDSEPQATMEPTTMNIATENNCFNEVIEHTYMRAFASMAFTLWTR